MQIAPGGAGLQMRVLLWVREIKSRRARDPDLRGRGFGGCVLGYGLAGEAVAPECAPTGARKVMPRAAALVLLKRFSCRACWMAARSISSMQIALPGGGFMA